MGSVKKLVVLDDEDELRKLSLLVFEKEDKASRSLPFGSREERHKYRQDCRSNHDSILAILESTKNLQDKLKDSDKADIAHDVYMYSLKGVNVALQTVYNRIIVKSRRGSIIRERLDKAFAAAGAAVLIFILGSMVWDIFSSSTPVETASKDINDLMSAIGGAAIGDIVAGTVASYAAAEGVELSSVFLTVLGFSTGVGAAILLAAAGGALIGLFFTSGGKKEHINRYQKELTYMARLDVIPDGAEIARDIARNRKVVEN